MCFWGAEPRHTTCLPGTGAGWLAACSKDQAKASSVARSRLPEDCRRRPPCLSPPAWPIPTSPTLALVPLPAPQLWLSPSMLSPYKFYQAIFQTADVDVARMLRALTALPLEEIEAVEAAMREAGYEANSAQRLLAEEVTRMVHGDQGLDQALKATQARAQCLWVCGRRVVWGRVGAAAGVLQALAAGREGGLGAACAHRTGGGGLGSGRLTRSHNGAAEAAARKGSRRGRARPGRPAWPAQPTCAPPRLTVPYCPNPRRRWHPARLRRSTRPPSRPSPATRPPRRCRVAGWSARRCAT